MYGAVSYTKQAKPKDDSETNNKASDLEKVYPERTQLPADLHNDEGEPEVAHG